MEVVSIANIKTRKLMRNLAINANIPTKTDSNGRMRRVANTFIINLDTMPKCTAQQKRYDGRRGIYFKSKTLIEAEKIFYYALKPHAPKKLSEAPIRLMVIFNFDVKDKKKWDKYKTTVPDVDNYAKAFIDQMTRCGYWKDDSQIADLHLVKTWGKDARIIVRWEEIKDDG